MSPEPPSTLVVAVLGMGVVFVFLVFLSTMMAALTAISGRGRARTATPAAFAPKPVRAGSPDWIAMATAVYLAAEKTTAMLPSAAAWRPYDTAEGTRWRLQIPPQTALARQKTS